MPTLPTPRCSITLDAFARITGLDPCGLYGIELPPDTPHGCVVFDCTRRTQFVYALSQAQALIQNAIEVAVCDTAKTLKAQYPYFAIPADWKLETRRTEVVEMTVEVPEPLAEPPCNTLITLTGEITLEECETFVNAELAMDGCNCPRLATEFCLAEYELVEPDPPEGPHVYEITLVLRAYNLNDSQTPVTWEDLDWLPETVNVDITIALPEKEATVFWKPRCCPVQSETCTATGCCHFQECCACIRRSPADVVEVLDWRKCCIQNCCNPFPHHFEINVVVPGAWKDGWEQAVVSLANNLLPQDWCACNPAANLRYMMDTGHLDQNYARPDSMFYSNPFGIFTAGAKKAWNTVSKVTEQPKVFSM